MKIKNISKHGYSCKLVGYDKQYISLKPGDICEHIPINCLKGLKGLTRVLLIGWEDSSEKAYLLQQNKWYYNVGEFDYKPVSNSTTTTTVDVTSVTLNKETLELTVGSKETLSATVEPSNATNSTVTWESSDTAIATVTSSGKVKAVAAGEATITATVDGKSATCVVTVTEAAAE